MLPAEDEEEEAVLEESVGLAEALPVGAATPLTPLVGPDEEPELVLELDAV